MKKIILLLCLLTISTILAQTKSLKLTNTSIGKERFIKEHKRIQIRTKQNRKIKGRFHIVDENTIAIKGQHFKLDDILWLHRNTPLDAIMIIVDLIWIGGASIIMGFNEVIPMGLSLVITGGTIIYGIMNPPNKRSTYLKSDNWYYSTKTNTKK